MTTTATAAWTKWMIDDLACSGISPEQAAEAGMRPVSHDERRDILGFGLPDMPDAYAIPFNDPVTGEPKIGRNGKPFVRVRLERPVAVGDSMAKYLSPTQSGNRLYVPCQTHKAWVDGDQVIVTEGEKKALSATHAGIPTAGLVGVWGFQDGETGDLISDLAMYITGGRRVTLVLDSDAALNVNIALAAHRFATCARNRGCEFLVHILAPRVELLQTDGKTGLDDALLAEVPDAVREEIDTARPVEGTAGDLLVVWLRAYAQYCLSGGMPVDCLAEKIVAKSYYDGIDGATRRHLTAELDKIDTGLLNAVKASVRKRLDAEFAGVSAPAQGGSGLMAKRWVRVAGGNEIARVDSLDGDIIWCTRDGNPHASRPYPKSMLELAPAPSQSAANGASGGRPPSPCITDMVDAFVAQEEVTIDGVLTWHNLLGQWYRSNGSHYQRVSEADLNSEITAFLRQHPIYREAASKRIVGDCINQMLSTDLGGMPSDTVLPVEFGDDGKPVYAPGRVSTMNCVLNLDKLVDAINDKPAPSSEIMHPPSPRTLTPYRFPFEFDPKAKCPVFEQYLLDVQPEQDARAAIQMMMGLLLVPFTRYNVFFFLVGRGGEGKSVLLYIIRKLLGDANICHLPFSKFGDKHSLHLLTQYLLNIIGEGDTELPREAGLGRVEGVLKDVCDGGLMPCEPKYCAPYMAPAIARCLAAGNALPTFYDRSEAIWDRLRVIPFNVRIRGTEKEDKTLRDRIVATELPGIFNFAIHGLAKLRKLGHFPDTAAGLEAKNKHRAASDHEAEFLWDNYEPVHDGTTFSTLALYTEYRSWMSARSYYPLGESRFAGSVFRVFPDIAKKKVRGADGKQFAAYIGLRNITEEA